MARVACYCKRYLINPENATYVKNGVPMCNAHTCEKVKEHDALNLRRTPYFDEEPWEDTIADPYGKSPQARYQDI